MVEYLDLEFMEKIYDNLIIKPKILIKKILKSLVI